MADINSIVITGTINDTMREQDVGDAHVVETELAFQVPGKDGPKEQWVQLQGWNDAGDELAKLHQGEHVIVQGSLNRRSWKDKDDEWQSRYSIRVSKVQAMGPSIPTEAPEPAGEEEPLPFS